MEERGHGDSLEYLVHYRGWKARYDGWMGLTLTLTQTLNRALNPNPKS